MKKFTDKNLPLQSGFTLIEMAISLMIVGLVLGAGASLYGQYIKQQAVDTTSSNIMASSNQLDEFQARWGRLPCPAPLNVARTDLNYGTENCAAAAVAAGAGTCSGGICVEQSVRGGPGLTGNEQLVLVGAIPFRTIQVEEDKTLDGYNNRMVYAVSYAAISDTTYSNHKGAISIRDSNNRPRTPVDRSVTPNITDGTALYLVLSHGEDRVGAYSNTGALVKPCVGGTQESENCNTGFETGTIAAPADSIYKSMAQSTGENANYFDDYISYSSRTTDQTWRRTTTDNDNIQDTSPNFIGVGVSTPAAELNITASAGADTLRVYGNDGSDGTIITSRIRDESGGSSFPTLALAGDNTTTGEGMKCPLDPMTGAQQYMVKIANGLPVCKTVITTIECPPEASPNATVLVGINPDGSANCAEPPVLTCPSQTVTVCNGSSNPKPFDIPAGATNATYTVPDTAGLCYQARFTCNGTNWVEDGSSGYCENPAPTVWDAYCGYILNDLNGGYHPWAWDGLAKVTTQASCAGDIVTYDVSDCKCKVATDTQDTACSAPFSGTYSATAKSECYGQNPPTDGFAPEPVATKQTFTTPWFVPTVEISLPAVTEYAGDSSSCTCENSTTIDFNYCPDGFRRKADPDPATFTSPAATWPSDTRLGAYRKTTVNPTTCDVTWDTWDTTNCECDTTPSYSSTPTDCSGEPGEAACNEPDTTSSVTIDGRSFFAGDDVTKTVNDPSDSCSPKSETVRTGTCRTKTFTWVQTGSTGTDYTSSNKPNNKVDGGCGCSDLSKTKRCYKDVPGDTTVYSCKCQ